MTKVNADSALWNVLTRTHHIQIFDLLFSIHSQSKQLSFIAYRRTLNEIPFFGQVKCWPCALRHGIQNSMEAMLACHPALPLLFPQNDWTGWKNGVKRCAHAPLEAMKHWPRPRTKILKKCSVRRMCSIGTEFD